MNDFKKLVQEIKKYAQTDLSGPAPKPVAKPGGGGGGSGQAYSGGNQGIINMQVAMQQLSQTVMKDSSLSIMQKTKEIGNAKTVTPESQRGRSKKGFADFIAEQYVGTLDDEHKGVEWSNDPKKDNFPKKEPSQSDIYELDAVMDTIRRIGSQGSEFKADGFWGFRTDNALRNMLGFAYALLQLEGDFGVQSTLYTKGNWNAFTYLLSGYEVNQNNKEAITLPPAEQNKRATEITKHLKVITKLYSEVRNAILARPMYRNYIEGDDRFDILPKDIGSTVTQNDVQNAISNHQSINVELPVWENNVQGQPQSVKLFMVSLTDQERFKNFIEKTLKCPTNQSEQQVFPIYKQIENQLFSMKDEQPAPAATPAPLPTGAGGGTSI